MDEDPILERSSGLSAGVAVRVVPAVGGSVSVPVRCRGRRPVWAGAPWGPVWEVRARGVASQGCNLGDSPACGESGRRLSLACEAGVGRSARVVGYLQREGCTPTGRPAHWGLRRPPRVELPAETHSRLDEIKRRVSEPTVVADADCSGCAAPCAVQRQLAVAEHGCRTRTRVFTEMDCSVGPRLPPVGCHPVIVLYAGAIQQNADLVSGTVSGAIDVDFNLQRVVTPPASGGGESRRRQ